MAKFPEVVTVEESFLNIYFICIHKYVILNCKIVSNFAKHILIQLYQHSSPNQAFLL